ncbi:hypothetical protein [Lacihabitans soyangensis]|uniref:6-bladed beta-propeller n=1 Tax=Lacihabitans soyangensis TaxID=869394 RepID=A0AAE3KVG4_9BACT|nr:hypothetical protein [Lacihabitans soyangensis]MCP9766163.1 hypothetical protein [Lacihabitans soyangensis]
MKTLNLSFSHLAKKVIAVRKILELKEDRFHRLASSMGYLLILFCLLYSSAYSQKLIFEKVIGEENNNEYFFKDLSAIELVNNNLAVFDNDKIVIIDSLGNLKCKFGGLSETTDNTGSKSNNIISDEFGNYIICTGQFRGEGIKLFSPKGEFIKILLDGGDKLVKGEGVMNPVKIRIYRNIYYVLDRTNSNIKKFDKNWNFLGIIGTPNDFSANFRKSPETRVNEYKFENINEPSDFLIDSKGNIIVADYGNSIKKFDNNGKFLKIYSFSKTITKAPLISIDEKDNIYILADNGSLFILSNNDVLLDTYKDALKQPNQNSASEIGSLIVDRQHFYLRYYYKNEITVLSRQNFNLLRKFKKKINQDYAFFNSPRKVVVNKNGDLIVYASIEDKLDREQLLITSPSFSDVLPSNLELKKKSSLYEYFNPICIAKSGKVFVTDTKNKKIILFDEQGNLIGDWKTNIPINSPQNTICRDTTIFVVEELSRKSNQILVFNLHGQFIKRIDKDKNNKEIQTFWVDADLKGNIYFSQGSYISIVDPLGYFIGEIGGYGKEIRKDLNTGVVQENDKIQLKIGDYKPKMMHFEGIMKFKIYEDKIFIADLNKIVVADLNGNPLGYLGGKRGSKIGEFHHITDFDIYKDKLYITDGINNRIVVYKIEL